MIIKIIRADNTVSQFELDNEEEVISTIRAYMSCVNCKVYLNGKLVEYVNGQIKQSINQ